MVALRQALARRRGARNSERGAAEPRGETRGFHLVRWLHDEHSARSVRSAGRVSGASMGGQAADPRAWWAGADASAAAVFLEVGEVVAADTIHHQRSSGLLGGQGLSQQRRSVDGRTLFVTFDQGAISARQ